ncbi:MAG: hypothetical protein L0Z50_00930 [Verrucomicrobiales bacterium]|nr:hypothetical protein [Verrucomicrobiales bacterium]
MSKTVLGRNLGALLAGTKTAESTRAGQTPESANAEALGPGLRKLLKGVEGMSPESVDGFKEKGTTLSGLATVPAWYFFGADLLLLLLASFLVWPGVAGTGKMVLAMISVIMGALLAIVPFLRQSFQGGPNVAHEKWVMARHGIGEVEKVLMVRSQELLFVGEVQHLPGGRVMVLPLGVEGSPPLTPTETQRLSGEAVDAYKQFIERRGKQFRASLQ